MADLSFTISHDAGKLADAMARAPNEVIAEFDLALSRAAIELSATMRAEAPVYRKELANSIQPARVGLLQHIVSARGKAYGPYVNDGTGPGGRPELDEILKWMTAHSITPRTPGMTQRSLAYLIRYSIAAHGIKANPFADRSITALLPRLDELISQAADKGLARAAQA